MTSPWLGNRFYSSCLSGFAEDPLRSFGGFLVTSAVSWGSPFLFWVSNAIVEGICGRKKWKIGEFCGYDVWQCTRFGQGHYDESPNNSFFKWLPFLNLFLGESKWSSPTSQSRQACDWRTGFLVKMNRPPEVPRSPAVTLPVECFCFVVSSRWMSEQVLLDVRTWY